MTVSSTTTRVAYTGNGVTTAFATTFPFFAASEIEVIERATATGAETAKVLTTHYTVSGGNGATGTVTAVSAPPATVQWVLRRKTARTQEIDYTPNDPFPAETHEQGLDRLKMNVLELGEENERALRFPKTDAIGLAATIPSSVARAGKAMGFDGMGAVTVSTMTLAGIEAGATDAAASAAASATSATNASNSASAATTSETNAAASAASSAASASTINLPAPVASTWLRRNAGNTAYETKTDAQARTLLDAERKLSFNIKDYGAMGDGVTNDTAAIQAAINAAVAAKGRVYCPGGIYIISRLNFTGINTGLIFEGDGWNNTRFMPLASEVTYSTATGHLFDCTGALNLTFRDFQVGAFNQTPVPTTCFFLGQVASNIANAFHFDGLYITGKYLVSPFYAYGVPSSDMINCDWYNYKSGAGVHAALWFTAVNDYPLSSDFAVVTAGTLSTSDWTITGCEFHKFAGVGADNAVLHFDGATDIRFFGGNATGGAQNYIATSGVVKRLRFHGTTFETESEPVTPTNVLAAGSTGAQDIMFDGCHSIGPTFVGGAGTFDAGAANKTVYMGHVSAGGTLAAGSTNYLGPVGTEANEANAHQIILAKGVLTHLAANSGGSPSVGKNFTVTVMINGAASGLTCAINGGGVSVSDVSHYVNVAAGDTISFRWVVDAGASVVGGQVAACGFSPAPTA